MTNNLKLIKAKSKEIIFKSSNSVKITDRFPPLNVGLERVPEIKCLGVTISGNFSVTAHVNEVIATYASSLYALRTLRAHGLGDSLLKTTFKSIVLSRLLYASPAWYGYANSADRNRMQSFINKAIRSNFCQAGVVYEELTERADQKLFKLILKEPSHVLHSLLPPKSTHCYNLRTREHQLAMPIKTSHLDNKNFVTRMLFNFAG